MTNSADGVAQGGVVKQNNPQPNAEPDAPVGVID